MKLIQTPRSIRGLPAGSLNSRRGFALVVTVSLMMLLTLLALGMLSLSSIVLRSTSSQTAQTLARNNARMALTFAIGELQRELGPDTRITAPHDLGDTDGGEPHWTAVYDSWEQDREGLGAVTPDSRTVQFRAWLASGANGASGGPQGDGGEIVMVGNGTLGPGADAEDRVEVPMLAVGDAGRGGLAWWTSDESFKAKVNAGPDGSRQPAAGLESPLLDAQSPPHPGHRVFEPLQDLEWRNGDRGLTVSDLLLDLVAGLEGGGLGRAFHEVTVHSAGVLADVTEGGLKHDLTALLTRDAGELDDKPLYLADGRINRFEIDDSGAISNAAGLPPGGDGGADRWGVNLEELRLFHQLHRELEWSGSTPRLVSKPSRSQIERDRFYLYRKPVLEAAHFIHSLRAVPDGGTDSEGNPTYKLQMMQDAMISFSNPNDIPLESPPGLPVEVDIHSIPYRFVWNIQRANGSTLRTRSTNQNSYGFKGRVEEGFVLEPGEAAVFGSSTSGNRFVTLQRGFNPSGGVVVENLEWLANGGRDYIPWNLRANGLSPDDVVDFTLRKVHINHGRVHSGFIMSRMRMGGSGGFDFGTFRLGGNRKTMDIAPLNPYLLSRIKPQQRLRVQEFIDRPMPVLMLSYMQNVEKGRPTTFFQALDSLPSRPFQLHEPATADRRMSTDDIEEDLQTDQWIMSAESMNYEFGSDRTLPAGEGGRNIYHGGGRDVGLGSFHVIKRRIPIVPPSSLGAFENAVACGFTHRLGGGALSGKGSQQPTMARAIGNSWAHPFIPDDQVYNGRTDTSWMVNTALWDRWFLSTLAGTGGSSPWMNDARSPREQFEDLATASGTLRNKRFLHYPHRGLDDALEELFDGDQPRPAAVGMIAKHLLVDGPFNVNSTSINAWKAMLASIRDQELLTADGNRHQGRHPLGTLGYAAFTSTSGLEGDWNGFRDLDDSEIAELAEAIVDEVKARGPFLSLADFVNRRPDSTDPLHRSTAALQTAIDVVGLNDRFGAPNRSLEQDDLNPLEGAVNVDHEILSARAIGSAGYLSQAALLTALGPQITVRGDTFKIRAYGEKRDASGAIEGRAWCEAVVQRIPEYVDSADAPEASRELRSANRHFGRRFEILSFRWLAPDEV